MTIKNGAMCAVALAVTAGSALGGVRSWTWERGDTNFSDGGGRLERVETTFNSGTQELTFSVEFSNQVTDGFTLAINDGPNPKGHAGELALVYFDASNTEDVRISAYAYNGKNTQTSYKDGAPQGGTQTPDQIATNSGSAARSGFASGSVADLEDGGRVLTMTLNTGPLNSHSPLHPGPGGAEEWFGIGFDELLGIWFHPVQNLTSSYDPSGYLSDWNGNQGYLDTENKLTVPAPGSIALAGFGGLLFSARRRR